MSRSELHNWECTIKSLCGENADKMLAIAQDIYNTAFVRGKDSMSSVTSQRPKGHWIEVEVHNCHATLKCSECDRVIEPTYTFGKYSYEDIKEFYPYCHCGADMRGERDETN